MPVSASFGSCAFSTGNASVLSRLSHQNHPGRVRISSTSPRIACFPSICQKTMSSNTPTAQRSASMYDPARDAYTASDKSSPVTRPATNKNLPLSPSQEAHPDAPDVVGSEYSQERRFSPPELEKNGPGQLLNANVSSESLSNIHISVNGPRTGPDLVQFIYGPPSITLV